MADTHPTTSDFNDGLIFSRISGSFKDSDLENKYSQRNRRDRVRFLQFFCLFGGGLFFLTGGVDYLKMGDTADFRLLAMGRVITYSACLFVAYKIRHVNDDLVIDRIMMVAILCVAIFLSVIPMFRVGQASTHELVAVFIVVLFYAFMPVRIAYLAFTGALMTLVTLTVMAVSLNASFQEMAGIFLLMLLANGIGFVNARRTGYLSRQNFWKNQLLREEVLVRQRIEQELRSSEDRLRIQITELKDKEERLEKQAAELVAIAEDMAAARGVAETSRQRLHDAIDNISEGFALYDNNLHLIVCNQRYRDLYGYSEQEASHGVHVEDLMDIDRERGVIDTDLTEGHKYFGRFAGGKAREKGQIVKLTDGRWLQIRDRTTSTGNIVSLQAEITGIKEAEERIKYLANHDALTGLPSLRLGMDRLTQALSTARREASMACVLFIDLDGFKGINDTVGHDAGDHVLKEVALRMKGCIRDMDTAARIGGDEFVVILSKVNEKAGVEKLAEKIVTAVRQPIVWQNQELSVGASVGIALYPENGDKPETLIKSADGAMYAVKASGKNHYAFAR